MELVSFGLGIAFPVSSPCLWAMAIVWSQNIEGNHYEVRSAGASLRLYRNGVNHSQWNPNRPLSGSIWDLITLPSLFRPRGSLRTALILGFGAGTVGRQFKELLQLESIVGIDMDPIHLSIADGFFDCAEGCDLMAADAVEWVRASAGDPEQRYDLIVDDLYGESEGMPLRYAPMDAQWFGQLGELLSEDGILILNLVEPDKVKHLSPFVEASLVQRFPYAHLMQMQGYENRILALSRHPFDADQFEANLKEICREYPRCHGVSKRYQMQSLRA